VPAGCERRHSGRDFFNRPAAIFLPARAWIDPAAASISLLDTGADWWNLRACRDVSYASKKIVSAMRVSDHGMRARQGRSVLACPFAKSARLLCF
jgi:hypothetical protein